MDKDFAWEKFRKSGKISDYLNYRKVCDNEVKSEDANNY